MNQGLNSLYSPAGFWKDFFNKHENLHITHEETGRVYSTEFVSQNVCVLWSKDKLNQKQVGLLCSMSSNGLSEFFSSELPTQFRSLNQQTSAQRYVWTKSLVLTSGIQVKLEISVKVDSDTARRDIMIDLLPLEAMGSVDKVRSILEKELIPAAEDAWQDIENTYFSNL
jgi:hypothetical protein